MQAEDPLRVDPEAPLVRAIASRYSTRSVAKSIVIPNATVRSLCDLAQFAPNHGRTWPARFAYVTGQARLKLAATLYDDLVEAGGTPDFERLTRKLTRTPGLLVVGAADGQDPTQTIENQYSVSAGIQNILLVGHSLGLGLFWSSPKLPKPAASLRYLKFQMETTLIAFLYVGQIAVPSPADRTNTPPAALTMLCD